METQTKNKILTQTNNNNNNNIYTYIYFSLIFEIWFTVGCARFFYPSLNILRSPGFFPFFSSLSCCCCCFFSFPEEMLDELLDVKHRTNEMKVCVQECSLWCRFLLSTGQLHKGLNPTTPFWNENKTKTKTKKTFRLFRIFSAFHPSARSSVRPPRQKTKEEKRLASRWPTVRLSRRNERASVMTTGLQAAGDVAGPQWGERPFHSLFWFVVVVVLTFSFFLNFYSFTHSFIHYCYCYKHGQQ